VGFDKSLYQLGTQRGKGTVLTSLVALLYEDVVYSAHLTMHSTQLQRKAKVPYLPYAASAVPMTTQDSEFNLGYQHGHQISTKQA
jgi:hypothetical protein